MNRSNRLTANRMLRIRKVIQYLGDKINIQVDPACIGSASSSIKPDASKKSFYVDLYCQGKVSLQMISWFNCASSCLIIDKHWLPSNMSYANPVAQI